MGEVTAMGRSGRIRPSSSSGAGTAVVPQARFAWERVVPCFRRTSGGVTIIGSTSSSRRAGDELADGAPHVSVDSSRDENAEADELARGRAVQQQGGLTGNQHAEQLGAPRSNGVIIG